MKDFYIQDELLINHQQLFVYRVVKNMKDAEEKPLYDINNNFYKENQMVGLKNNLAGPPKLNQLYFDRFSFL